MGIPMVFPRRIADLRNAGAGRRGCSKDRVAGERIYQDTFCVDPAAARGALPPAMLRRADGPGAMPPVCDGARPRVRSTLSPPISAASFVPIWDSATPPPAQSIAGRSATVNVLSATSALPRRRHLGEQHPLRHVWDRS